MMAFVTAPENIFFSVALAVMFGIALLEGITTLLGAGISNVIESLLPDSHGDFDIDSSEAPAGPFSKLLSWIRVGEVPVLMLLVVFLATFGLIGLGVQSVIDMWVGSLAPASIAGIVALFLSLPAVRVVAGGLARVMPGDETDAISEDSFVGRVAEITLGKAEVGSPAQAKLRDEHGQIHYMMVEPDLAGEILPAGSEVILVSRAGAVFKVIANNNAALMD